MIWEKDGSSLEIRIQGQLPDGKPAHDETVVRGASVHLEQITPDIAMEVEGQPRRIYGSEIRGYSESGRKIMWPCLIIGLVPFIIAPILDALPMDTAVTVFTVLFAIVTVWADFSPHINGPYGVRDDSYSLGFDYQVNQGVGPRRLSQRCIGKGSSALGWRDPDSKIG